MGPTHREPVADLADAGVQMSVRCRYRMGASSGRNSVAECQLPKLDVAGSNPVGRSNTGRGYGEPP